VFDFGEGMYPCKRRVVLEWAIEVGFGKTKIYKTPGIISGSFIYTLNQEHFCKLDNYIQFTNVNGRRLYIM
jgi:hypothetical protein